jgi:signal transduction histidine kinase
MTDTRAEDGRIPRLIDAAERLGRGEFDLADLPADPDDEVAHLGRALHRLAADLEHRVREETRLYEITSQINAGLLLDDVLDNVFEGFRGIIPFDRIGFSLIDADGDHVTARWARSDVEPLRLSAGYRAALAGSSLQEIIDTGRPRIINDLESYLAAKPDSESTQLIVAEGIRSSLTCPLVANGVPVGFMFFSSRRPGTYTSGHAGIYRRIASQLSVIVDKGRLASEIAAGKAELEEQNARLRSLDDVKNRLLGMAAHDLRNPLAGILMSAALLGSPESGLDDVAREEVLADIERQAGYVLSMVDELLDVSRIESGRLDLDLEEVDLAAFLVDAVRRHALLAAPKRIRVVLAGATGTVLADPRRLRQAVDNLVSNAVKYSPAGSLVEVWTEDTGSGYLISVQDEGPGVDPGSRERVFDYFGRSGAMPTGGESSTGLGLAITRRIVHAHGGEVGIDEAPEGGSRFWFTLPHSVT